MPTLESSPPEGRSPRKKGDLINSRYRVAAVLGHGGMGIVYKVEDVTQNQRVLALKVMSASAIGAGQHEWLKAEFRMMSRLRHPNVTQVYDFEEVVGSEDYLFTMEYVDGTSLKAAARGRGWQEVLDLLVQVCRALGYLHSRNVIHFDLKPANVLVARSGEVKVVDFGVALVRASQNPVSIRGTPQYMAPELIRHDWRIDHRVDIYSLGIMSYELLQGRVPFKADSLTDIFLRHETSEIEFDPTIPLPEWLRAIVRRMCAKDPADRFPTANAIIEAINAGGGTDYELETQETKESYIFSSRLVGREAEFSQIKDFIHSRTSGHGDCPSCLCIVGPGGTGKSRLLLEARHFAQLSRLRFVSAQCYEDAFDAYAPIASLVRVLVSLAEAHGKGTLIERYRNDLDAVLSAHPGMAATERVESARGPGATGLSTEPNTRESLESNLKQGVSSAGAPVAEAPGGADGTHPSDNLDEVLGRVAMFMALLSETVPFVVCLDDLQWARDVVTRLVDQLVRRLAVDSEDEGTPRIALIAACRDEEARGRPAGLLLERLRARDAVRTIVLNPLEREHVQEVIQSMLGVDTLPQPFVDRVYQETDGTPFFVEEVMRTLVESGAVRVQGGRWAADASIGNLEIPDGVVDVLTRRLSFLDDRARRVLVAMSVHDGPVSTPVLLRTSGLERAALHEVLGDLTQRRMAVRLVDDEIRYRVAHDRMRAVVYGGLAPDERASWHAKLGEALEAVAQNGSPPVYELARHFYLAGETDKALHYSLEGGKMAMRSYAFDLAIQLLNQARALMQSRDPSSPILDDLEEWLGDCHAIQGRDEESLAYYQRVAKQQGSTSLTTLKGARIRWKVSSVMMTRDEWRLAAQESWEAIQALGGREPRTRAGYVVATVLAGVRHLAHRLFPRLVNRRLTGKQLERAKEMASAYVRLIIAYAMVDPFRSALATLRASNLADRIGLSTQACEASAGMCVLARMTFPRWATYDYGIQALEMAEKLNSVWHEADAYRALGISASYAGNVPLAVHYLEEAVDRFEQCKDFFWTSICYLVLFACNYNLVKLSEALSCLDRGRGVLKRLGERHPYHRRLDATACWLHAQMGNMLVEDAVARLIESRALHSGAGDMLFASATTWMAGELLLRAGDHDRAIELLEEATAPGERRLFFEWDMPPYLFLAQALMVRLLTQKRKGMPLDLSTLRRVRRLVVLGLSLTKYRHRNSRAQALLCKAIYCWLRGRRAKAATYFARSRQTSRVQGTVLWWADAHVEEARCWMTDGTASGRDHARKSLLLALETYDRAGTTLQANGARALLRELEAEGTP